MSVFGDYSQYYNLLYKDKNYESETKYVSDLIQQYKNNAKTLLDLGCGSGRHDECFAKHGYNVSGVDLSEDMLQMAYKIQKKGILEFSHGDARNVRLNKKFDAVVSLFHVMNYQITNTDLENAFNTARAHLDKGGVFIFDSWHGPGVLTDRPSNRIKELEDQNLKIFRTATPEMWPNECIVDVNYDLKIFNKKLVKEISIKEKHRMRYLFSPEVEYFLSKTEFKLKKSEEWQTKKKLGFDSWFACYIAEAI